MMVGGDQALPYIETWIRNALSLPHQPAIMVLDPGEGARKPDGQGKLPTDTRGGTPDDYSRAFRDRQTGQDLLRYYEHFGVHTQVRWCNEGIVHTHCWCLAHHVDVACL
jgi:hypothetical protein